VAERVQDGSLKSCNTPARRIRKALCGGRRDGVFTEPLLFFRLKEGCLPNSGYSASAWFAITMSLS
jgi:hypothetical protein